MSELRTAKVVAVYGKAHAVDIIYMDSLARVPMVPVLEGAFSSRAGRRLLMKPTAPATDGDVTPTKDTDIYAAVGTLNGVPVVVAFLPPQVSHLMFDRDNFLIDRHPSDVYTTIDDNGNVEHYHPSGTYIRIAEDPAHEDLDGKDFDQKFKTERNTSRLVHLQVVLANGGSQKASLHVDPNGNVEITAVGNWTQTVQGNLSQTVQGTANVAVNGAMTSSAASWTHTGDVEVDGNLHVTKDVNSDQTITGTTDVVGGGKSVKTHVHTDPQGGNTGAPV